MCEDKLARLNYTPVKLAKKFAADEFLLKTRIGMYVTSYYPYIHDCFEGKEAKDCDRHCLERMPISISAIFNQEAWMGV